MYFFPDVVGGYLPFLLFVVAMHLSWEILHHQSIRDYFASLKAKRHPMLLYCSAFLIGGLVAVGYWRGISLGLSALSKAEDTIRSSHLTANEEPPLSLFVSERDRFEVSEIKFKNSLQDLDAQNSIKLIAKSTSPRIRFIPFGQTSTIDNIVIRNKGKVPITNASVSITADVPIKGESTGGKQLPFSDTQADYKIPLLKPFSELTLEYFISISVATSKPSTEVFYMITIQADNVRHYAGVVRINYLWLQTTKNQTSKGVQSENKNVTPSQDSNSTTPPVVQNCPGGICAGGDISGSPTIINPAPPLAKVTWTQEPLPVDDKHRPGVMVTLTVDNPLPDSAFGAECDNPCEGITGGSTTGPTMESQVHAHTITGKEVPAMRVDLPNPLRPNFKLNWELRSLDDRSIRVTRLGIVKQR